MNNAENLLTKRIRATRAPTPPGPKGHPILGVMPEFDRDTLGFVKRCRDYGDVVQARFLYVQAYFLFNPDDIEYILSTNAKNFIKPVSLRSNFFRRLLGNGLLTSEGEFWKRQRRLSQPAFHRDRLVGFAATMAKETNRMLARWERLPRTTDGKPPVLDVHAEMMRLTFAIVGHTLFTTAVGD